MAIQEIRYGGMTAQPSDYENKDGELAVSVNLLNEEGHLSPLLPAEVVKQLPEGTKGCWVHRTSEYMHYIVWVVPQAGEDEMILLPSLKWIDSENMETIHDMNLHYEGITKVVPLGNTLCILHEGGMVYLLWKDGEYKELSPNLPEVKLSFGLQCEWKEFKKRGKAIIGDDYFEKAGTIIMGCLNKVMADCAQESKFAMPFFVRYAYRMFDGSLTQQSQPILMIPTTREPVTFARLTHGKATNIYDVTGQVAQENVDCHYYHVACYAPACDLDMAITNIAANLNDYSEIIRTLEIFVSSPLFTYDQSKNVFDGADWSNFESYWKDIFYDEEDNFGIYKLKNAPEVPGTVSVSIADKYAKFPSIMSLIIDKQLGMQDYDDTYNDAYNYENFMNYLPQYFYGGTNNIMTAGRIKPPVRSLQEQVEMCSTYYRVKSIPLADLIGWNDRAIIDIDKGVLSKLESHEALTDDYDSHCKKTANTSYSYNQRLLLGGVNKKLFDGYFNMSYITHYITATPSKLAQNKYVYMDTTIYDSSVERPLYPVWTVLQTVTSVQDNLFKIQDVRVKIKKNGKDYTVKEEGMVPICSFDRFDPAHGTPEWNDGGRFVFWFYYPDADAYEVVLSGYFENEHNAYILKFALKPHDMLNGAYYFSNFEWKGVYTCWTQDITEETYLAFLNETYLVSTDKTIEQPNKLYTSEVLNPWYFPVEGIVTVGNGELLALSAATQALSQGQFGEFPLYAFCSDGVWALTVGDTGYFTRSVPVSRDVCTNPESVLQIDDAVIYPTDRGLMLLAGSKNVCFTEPMNNREGKDYESQLPGMRELRAMAGLTAPSTNATVATRQNRCLNPAPLREFLQDCKMIYDYVGQRIIVYNPTRGTVVESGNTVSYRKYSYALVYSLKTNLWGMTESDLQLTVNSYPEAMGMTDEKKLVVFSKTTQEESSQQSAVTGLFVTRPLKLGAPDVLKTVRTVMQRGMFRRGNVKSVLWGSRDLYNWYLIHSSQDEGLHNMSGTPYKYFIIGGLVTLTEGKSVSGASLEVEAKMTDVLR